MSITGAQINQIYNDSVVKCTIPVLSLVRNWHTNSQRLKGTKYSEVRFKLKKKTKLCLSVNIFVKPVDARFIKYVIDIFLWNSSISEDYEKKHEMNEMWLQSRCGISPKKNSFRNVNKASASIRKSNSHICVQCLRLWISNLKYLDASVFFNEIEFLHFGMFDIVHKYSR